LCSEKDLNLYLVDTHTNTELTLKGTMFNYESEGVQALENLFSLDFCLTVHHQLGKVIQMNQLHATMIY